MRGGGKDIAPSNLTLSFTVFEYLKVNLSPFELTSLRKKVINKNVLFPRYVVAKMLLVLYAKNTL